MVPESYLTIKKIILIKRKKKDVCCRCSQMTSLALALYQRDCVLLLVFVVIIIKGNLLTRMKIFGFGSECRQSCTLTNLAARRTLRRKMFHASRKTLFRLHSGVHGIASISMRGIYTTSCIKNGSLDPPASQGPKFKRHLSRVFMVLAWPSTLFRCKKNGDGLVKTQAKITWQKGFVDAYQEVNFMRKFVLMDKRWLRNRPNQVLHGLNKGIALINEIRFNLQRKRQVDLAQQRKSKIKTYKS